MHRTQLLAVAALSSCLLVSVPPAAGQIQDPPAVDGRVVINEIFYAPLDKTSPEEFLELHNKGAAPVDISGWAFTNGISWRAPAGTSIAAGGYLVVAQDPAVLQTLYGVSARGPYFGRLDGDGERVVLRNAAGGVEDEVDYQLGFPWPTTGRPENNSIELIHPDLDNDLGGSWRSSDPTLSTAGTLVRSGEVWKYLKGTAAAPSAWRSAGFDDASWSQGAAPIGYGETFLGTTLSDMRNGYSSVYLRKSFQVDDPAAVSSLTLEVLHDDGFNAWINGTHVAGNNVSGTDLPHDAIANGALESVEYVPFALPRPSGYLVRGQNVLAIQLHNSSLGASSDAYLDARLITGAGGSGPTPGARNSVWSEACPPHLRQVVHAPEQPVTGIPVLVTVKATDLDGVSSAVLEYQIVEPGQYIRLEDAAYATGWTSLAMNDQGLAGDQFAGDDTWSVLVPASVQEHRRLVRYRIAATDGNGLSVKVPYPDDPQPNFAYFVYDSVPPWTAAARPGTTPPVVYEAEVLESVPVYQLITRRIDHLNAMNVPYRWGKADQQTPTSGQYWGEEYPWLGTLVYGGKVYDHIRYRARGGVWRYSMGKNMWKFDFLRGHYFRAVDDHGRQYDTPWDKLNFSAIIQQGNFGQRGEQGLFEAAGFRLHNLVGNPASLTHFVTFRIVEGEDELGPDQFSGDFQGLYLVIEQMDGRFLQQHRLPDGNLYKMEGGTGELNNQGPDQPSNKADLNAFLGGYTGGSASQDWWLSNLDLADYFNYRAILLAIHDYDDHAGKNYFYFNNPEIFLWQIMNWDLDLCWTTTYGGGGGADPLNSYVLSFPAFQLEFKNRVREIRDLLFNPDQTGQVIDEAAGVVYAPGGPAIVDADRAMWDYNPILVSSYTNPEKASHGRFYQAAPTRNFPGMAQIMKSYINTQGAWLDSSVAADSAIPTRPTVTSLSPTGYPVDALRFRASAFADPQGAGTFGGMKWRLGEVTPTSVPGFVRGSPRRYEMEAVWESPILATYEPEVQIPPTVAGIGRTYRARVRMRDTTGRWSRWSEPVEFVAGDPTSAFPQQAYLRVTEVMYHPPYDADLEFIELVNTGPVSIDLDPVSFSDGIEFRFAEGAVRTLGPGERVLVVADLAAFDAYYDTAGMLIAGEFGNSLANGGETITLVHGANAPIVSFTYSDDWYVATDGLGRSLTIVDTEIPQEDWSLPESWKESSAFGGTPGFDDGGGPVGGLQRPGDANQDAVVDISDAFAILLHLFVGGARPLPCDGAIGEGGNAILLDADGSASVDIADAIHILQYLFQSGPAPAGGTRCVRIEGCPNACR